MDFTLLLSAFATVLTLVWGGIVIGGILLDALAPEYAMPLQGKRKATPLTWGLLKGSGSGRS
jgi:hypothetical protein